MPWKGHGVALRLSRGGRPALRSLRLLLPRSSHAGIIRFVAPPLSFFPPRGCGSRLPIIFLRLPRRSVPPPFSFRVLSLFISVMTTPPFSSSPWKGEGLGSGSAGNSPLPSPFLIPSLFPCSPVASPQPPPFYWKLRFTSNILICQSGP